MKARLGQLWSRISAFARREDGSIAVETVVIIPALFWTYLAMYAIFDSYRQQSVNQKIAFTIGDIISRETTPLDDNYITGMRDLLKYMANKSSNSDVTLRVTVVRWDEDDDRHYLDWSKEIGAKQPLTQSNVLALKDRLPVMVNTERLILVETYVNYDPPFNTGLQERVIENFVFTRPRYAPQVLFSN